VDVLYFFDEKPSPPLRQRSRHTWRRQLPKILTFKQPGSVYIHGTVSQNEWLQNALSASLSRDRPRRLADGGRRTFRDPDFLVWAGKGFDGHDLARPCDRRRGCCSNLCSTQATTMDAYILMIFIHPPPEFTIQDLQREIYAAVGSSLL